VTVNGAYSKELSNAVLDENFLILDFNDKEALRANPEAKSIVDKYFANNIGRENNYFKLINTALMTKGFLLYLKDNHQALNTLQIIHISNQNHFNQMRSLIYLGRNSSLNLVVSYIGLAETQYFTNAVIEAHLEDSASLKLDKIQNESRLATRLYNFYASVSNHSNFEYNALSFGAKSNREEINIDINGQYSDVKINGLYALNSNRKSHHKVVINHNLPHSTSRQVYKGLLQGSSKAEFNGLINVCRDAQQTSASQLNRNLLLSDLAHIDSRPQLNIEADDVKCSHGSSTSTLSADELFYLKSRGLSEVDAKNVLTYSFCQEIISALNLESARNYSSNLANLSQEADNQVIAALADNAKFKQSRYQQ
jgi:Fe-S cluster assembly protein SufD